MRDTWFISDTHFSHKGILEYEKESRPFNTIEEMNETLIERWNNVVKPKDTIYHLGDFCFGKANIAIAGRLNGRKILVMGNHDTYKPEDYSKYFDRLHGALFWHEALLTHIPVHPEHSRCFLNVHGHLHSKRVEQKVYDLFRLQTGVGDMDALANPRMKEDKNYFNVSCEQNNLTPIHADVIRNRIKDLKE